MILKLPQHCMLAKETDESVTQKKSAVAIQWTSI